MSMIVRPLTLDDMPAYRKLRLRALQEHPESFGSSYEEELSRTLLAVQQRYQSLLDTGGITFGAYHDGNLCGIVTLGRNSHTKMSHRAGIFGMYVAPECRKMGMGRALMDVVINHARSIDTITVLALDVTIGNDPALKLYQTSGFEIVGKDPRAICIDGTYFDMYNMVRFLD